MELIVAIIFLCVCALGIFLWYAWPYILVIGVILAITISLVCKARLKNIEKGVVKAEVVDETPIIERVAENTGYTVSYGRGISSHNHYRYKNVKTGDRVSFSVTWKNGKKEVIECKKDSATYKRLIVKT